MSELDKLRTLLLNEEQEKLELYREELDATSLAVRSPELIINKLAPLFSAILDRSYHNDKALILEIFTPIVNELIDKSYSTSQDKISRQIAPLISSAIRQQIKTHKDDVVDALSPVMGSMISRYITRAFEEMLTSINMQVQNGLSFKALKRKVNAKIKGVSETELLLKENVQSNIRAVFLIHKESGTVLSHTENPEYPISEPEMIACDAYRY